MDVQIGRISAGSPGGNGRGDEHPGSGTFAWLPLSKRDYDAETDTLTIGLSSVEEALVTENANIVGYWAPDELDPSDFMNAIGVAIRNASVHLGNMQVPGVKRKA